MWIMRIEVILITNLNENEENLLKKYIINLIVHGSVRSSELGCVAHKIFDLNISKVKRGLSRLLFSFRAVLWFQDPLLI